MLYFRTLFPLRLSKNHNKTLERRLAVQPPRSSSAAVARQGSHWQLLANAHKRRSGRQCCRRSIGTFRGRAGSRASKGTIEPWSQARSRPILGLTATEDRPHDVPVPILTQARRSPQMSQFNPPCSEWDDDQCHGVAPGAKCALDHAPIRLATATPIIDPSCPPDVPVRGSRGPRRNGQCLNPLTFHALAITRGPWIHRRLSSATALKWDRLGALPQVRARVSERSGREPRS